MSSMNQLGKAVGVTVRTWVLCLTEFVEGFREGAPDLDELNAKLVNVAENKTAGGTSAGPE